MQYQGSKLKVYPKFKSIIQNYINDYSLERYIEPFVGSCGAMMYTDDFSIPRYGYDYNFYIISLWNSLKEGYQLPEEVSPEFYKEVKNNKLAYHPALVAFIGYGCSFGAKWFNGYAKNSRGDDYTKQAKGGIAKKLPKIQSVEFSHRSYDAIFIPDNSMIYCDPPYRDTLGYKNSFNHDAFWEWVRYYSKNNVVLVSEYTAPEDFTSIWSKDRKVDLTGGVNGNAKISTEKLFIHNSLLTSENI